MLGVFLTKESNLMKFLGTVIIFACLALAATMVHARAQSVWSNAQMRGVLQGSYDPVHMCKYATKIGSPTRAKFCAEARQVIIQRKVRR
jgi:hypothetical protein